METIYLLSYTGNDSDFGDTGIIAAFKNKEEATRAKNTQEAREWKEYSARIAEGYSPTRILYHVKPIDLISRENFRIKD